MWSLWIFLLACTSDSANTTPDLTSIDKNTISQKTGIQDTEKTSQNPTALKMQEGNLDKGQQHPPIPPDNPVWEWDAQAFVPDHGWFGEHNWYDVRMRVVGHLAMVYRDLARSYILQGNWSKASETYDRLAEHLQNIDTSKSDFAEQIRQLLIKSAQRDHGIITALYQKTAFPQNIDGLMALRVEYWKLIDNPNPTRAKELQKELQPYLILREDLKIDGFENFTDRHHLRQRLFEAYAQSSDPLLPFDDRWGYWRPEEIQRQALALGLALGHLGGEDWSQKTNGWLIPFKKQVLTLLNTSSISEVDLRFLPSIYSKHLLDPYNQLQLTAEEFGRLPTGDSLIDVTGQPGPMGIGSLMKLDVSDPIHNAWLLEQIDLFEKALQENPEAVVQTCQKSIAHLDAQSFGSRFYNVKQFRNACTRQLASLGEYTAAQEIYAESLHLHHQDWACPNRKGLVLGVIGRLQLQNQDISQSQETLEQAIQEGQDFLNNVNLAMQGKLTEPRPPMFKVPVPPNGKSHHNPGNVKGPPGNFPPSPPKHE